MTPLFAFFNLSLSSLVIILLVGALLFGNKLPEVGRSFGKLLAEFQKSLKGVEQDIDSDYAQPRRSPATLEAPRPPERVATTTPKFEESTAIQQAPGVQTGPAPQH
jgi:sec-independent protein translocase protein TatA